MITPLSLLYDTKFYMCSAGWQLHHLYSLQLNRFSPDIFKWPKTAAKEHRHNVNVQLIGKSCSEALLCGACGAYHCNIFITGSRFGLPDGTFYAIRDEGKS